MKGLFFLCALLCGAQTSSETATTYDYAVNTFELSISSAFSATLSTDETTNVASTTPDATTPSPESKSQSTSRSPDTESPTIPIFNFSKKCIPELMVSGGLIIACAILLVCIVALTWKVCQLSRHVKMLSSNADLISTNDYWMGTAKKNKETEAEETTVLMSDINPTMEEMGNGTTKEEGGKAKEDGQTEQEDKKEVGDTSAKSEDASATPVTVDEKAASSKPQEEPIDAQSTNAVAASSSEGTEEPKDGV
ncbi:uncharacterized protein LOC116700938 [Etheostoma spectabile]|uniref:uncharacterized protein LOC116700938 n=1 Tax=Etheostoma spectabile TaxID=54343 RepID=UPI0013AE8E48|nr:uncharacterized protein LOC116700938 [Etheostoma spectabile]XP_032390303.1 uncharacterized protein LOC116700938 [Etheostoma spectabile]